MSSNRLEQIRQRMEDMEWIKQAIVATLQKKNESPKQKVTHDHVINNLLNMVQVRALDVLEKTKGDEFTTELRKMTLEYGAVQTNRVQKEKKRRRKKKIANGKGKGESGQTEEGKHGAQGQLDELAQELDAISKEVGNIQISKNTGSEKSQAKTAKRSPSNAQIADEEEPESDPDRHLTVWQRLERDLDEQKKYQKSFIPKTVQAPHLSQNFFLEAANKPPYAKPAFTAEEHDGRSLDAQHLFLSYQQMPILKKKGVLFKDSLQFITHFDQIFDVGLDAKMANHRKFRDFYAEIEGYLSRFFKKVQPLVDFEEVRTQIRIKFEEKKKQKTLKGYFQLSELNEKDGAKGTKRYCEACQKTFNNDNVYVHHLKGKKHLRNERGKKRLIRGLDQANPNNQTDKPQSDPNSKQQLKNQERIKQNEAQRKLKFENKKFEIGFLEHSILELKNLLIDIFENTSNFLRRKQTYDRDNLSEESIQSEDDLQLSDEEEEGHYNPKNLPIGWDGKPIPYWLFKLHGLGIEYKCEICGNYSYWGRRAFEKHFTEWRHSYGMKCLKVPNSVHFREITSINDALILHKKLLLESQGTRFNPDKEEEFEDSEGNVLDKRTYFDLQKQGLL